MYCNAGGASTMTKMFAYSLTIIAKLFHIRYYAAATQRSGAGRPAGVHRRALYQSLQYELRHERDTFDHEGARRRQRRQDGGATGHLGRRHDTRVAAPRKCVRDRPLQAARRGGADDTTRYNTPLSPIDETFALTRTVNTFIGRQRKKRPQTQTRHFIR